ncbi:MULTISPECIES: GIY-YIG nuclease family protein [Rhodanobacter]|uniref:GIY-YIG nuclease family protein n=1 Tax=Rhodanobacter TaxID=75309 RepID=UPI0009DBE843|nr:MULTISPECIES: GIY-YIG nuclease family protein [Rhodanobacter]UJJ49835.1 GIY-YIG nuclease family protein [Rhodanobacter denitrificans]UJM92548.1 GIY-YIG nuclease family protein [Rhodanobacter denitrificans]UJM96078.1 GIY-YIG nuclease family protein [Rhodanobacter denitrificans]UJN21091.1 GIY-YIG nuclease family protein [Rhodanobacter denitrificans]
MSDPVDQRGWLYICMDIKDPGSCKVGCTRRALYKRITETGNPDYMIVKAYKVPPEEAFALERHLQREVSKVARRKPHILSGRRSEWFECSPKVAANALEHDLAKCLGLQDEDGNPMLSHLIFKPHLNWVSQMQLSGRVSSEEHFENVIAAISEA